MMTLESALEHLLASAQAQPPLAAEWVPTMDALGRVLAQDLVSPLDVPPADNTSMDGYALAVQDAATEGVVLPVSQRIAAGHAPEALQPRTAARIFTGGFVPLGANAVVMQEHCVALEGGRVQIQAVPTAGQWIRRAGEDVRRGDAVLRAGGLVTPQAMGQAAGVGADRLLVRKRLRVALMSTGDELVMPGSVAPDAMPIGAIYNSNRFTLRGLLQAAGCVVSDLGIVADRLSDTRQALRDAAMDHDLIITSGGVSVGEEDHVRPALEAEGRVSLWQLAIKPGKPLAFGAVRRGPPNQGEALFVGLPGNPVSSFVTFLLAAWPMIMALQGAAQRHAPNHPMRADFAWPKPDTKRREFLRVRRNGQGGLDLFPNQSSGVLSSAVWGDGLVDVAVGQTVQQGDLVPFTPWSAWGLRVD